MSPTRALLISSNGAGMGHLTRLCAVALGGAGALDATLLSLSVALPVTGRLGLRGEYCPSPERGWFPPTQWHGYLRDRIVALVRELDIEIVAFDGVAPYPGIGFARLRLPDVAFVWFRRGMWRPGVNVGQLAKSTVFDRILEPGDLAADADRGATAGRDDAIRIPPISMVDVVDRLPRPTAASELNLDPNRPTALVTLGTGRLGDVAQPGKVALDELMRHTDWQLCVTRPDVALHEVPVADRSRIVELRGVYPLVRYFAAFDAVVSAAGYNAAHEFVPAGIPTLLVPNPATTTDDQVARADEIARQGLALSAHPGDETQLRSQIRELVDDDRRAGLRTACELLAPHRRGGGAVAAGRQLAELGRSFEPGRPSLSALVAHGKAWTKERVKQTLGPERTAAVRRMLGRVPLPGPEARLKVVLESEWQGPLPPDTESLLIGADISAERIRQGGPVEHLLAGTADSYRAGRFQIAAEHYQIVTD